ncbi:hypothetical protein [Streptomyces sp. cg35]|uniref:hypothetical protein n=1 Tax=Streptomyces sp. cg35 TaxID=3421650 RepID=UPI003D181FCE
MSAAAAAETGLSEFQQNLVVAVVGGIIGILGTVAVERVKLRREPTKRLHWDAKIHNAMVSTDDSIRQRLQLTYNGYSIEGLNSVTFRVENTGNRVVRGQLLRFGFPRGQVIEAVPAPAPEREMGVARRPEHEQSPGEAVFTIGHLERSQAVTLRISVSARDINDWKVFAHNDEGDVEFHERTAARIKADREHVPTFFSLAFLLLTAPQLAALLGDVGRVVGVALGAALLISSLPHVLPTGRALRDFLTRPEPSRGAIHIGTVDSSTFAIGDRASAEAHYPPPNA